MTVAARLMVFRKVMGAGLPPEPTTAQTTVRHGTDIGEQITFTLVEANEDP